MKTLAATFLSLCLVACGGPAPKSLSATVFSNATGKALQPSAELMAMGTSFDSTDNKQTFTLEGSDLTKLLPLFLAVQAIPATFADGLTISATPTVIDAMATLNLSTNGSETDGCELTFAKIPGEASSTCGKDLVAGLKLIPAPAKVDVTATFDNAASLSLRASIVSPSGVGRTLAWGQQGTIAQVAMESKQTIDTLKETQVTGTINVAQPPNTNDVTATVILIVDYNADGAIAAEEVISGTVAIGEDVNLSTIITSAQAEKIVRAAEAKALNYALVVALRTKTGAFAGAAAMNGVDVKASLSFATTATTKTVQ
ncbi:MAG: hypothetical protein IT381_24240 [Deltaproteobacteria bacterium]|nr:hypothetical protein [Deltaproteobacteria bacterium]